MRLTRYPIQSKLFFTKKSFSFIFNQPNFDDNLFLILDVNKYKYKFAF